MTIDVSLACSEYEWTRSLWNGSVEPEGIDLTTIDYHNPERFARMVRNLEFDVCEMSMGTYLTSRSASGSFPFTAIPVFPSRRFRHAYVYKRTGTEIEEPRDLTGKNVGIVSWQVTSGIWQRGILGEHHGLDLRDVNWIAGGNEIIDLDLPSEYDVEYTEDWTGRPLDLFERMAERGELDAMFYPMHTRHEDFERLFADPLAVEQEYYRETSIFPIMHTVVIKDSLLAEHPWCVQKLYDAFEEAKRDCLERFEDPQWMPLAWAQLYREQQRRVLGDDPWEYGLTDSNVATIEKFVEYALQQGIISERYDVDELFATETLNLDHF